MATYRNRKGRSYTKNNKKYYKKQQYKRKSNYTKLTNLIKSVTLKQCETKTSNMVISGQTLFHNATFYKDNLMRTTLGTGDNTGFTNSTMNGSRIGDEIIAKGILFKFYHECAATRPNVVTKIYIFSYRAGVTVNDALFWCGSDGVGGNMLRLIDVPNSERITVLKTFTIQHQPNYANVMTSSSNGNNSNLNRICGTFRQCYVPLKNAKVLYSEQGNVPKWKDIGVAVINCDANGTLQTDLIGYINFTARLYYKDP